MARKIFVTYKHNDRNVAPLGDVFATARDYVDELIELFKGDEIYKGEGNEDLSEFKDETIATHLKEKIYDSSMTLVLISPNMKDKHKKESDQWIPWEVSYSLKEISREGRTSRTNAMLAIVLPNSNFDYSYYLREKTCHYYNCITLETQTLFRILKENMFNIKSPAFSDCENHQPKKVYTGCPSYIDSVKWCDFIADREKHLKEAEDINSDIDNYEIVKTISD